MHIVATAIRMSSALNECRVLNRIRNLVDVHRTFGEISQAIVLEKCAGYTRVHPKNQVIIDKSAP